MANYQLNNKMTYQAFLTLNVKSKMNGIYIVSALQPVSCYLLHIVCYLLSAMCHLLPSPSSSLPAACFMLSTTIYLLLAAFRLLFVVCYDTKLFSSAAPPLPICLVNPTTTVTRRSAQRYRNTTTAAFAFLITTHSNPCSCLPVATTWIEKLYDFQSVPSMPCSARNA